MPDCHECHTEFPNFKELALHIVKFRQKHPRRSVVWAEKFLTNSKWLNRKRDKPQGRMALTEEEKENKAATHVELSGSEKVASTFCPKCKSICRQSLPVEYVNSSFAWRNQSGVLVVSCPDCVK